MLILPAEKNCISTSESRLVPNLLPSQELYSQLSLVALFVFLSQQHLNHFFFLTWNCLFQPFASRNIYMLYAWTLYGRILHSHTPFWRNDWCQPYTTVLQAPHVPLLIVAHVLNLTAPYPWLVNSDSFCTLQFCISVISKTQNSLMLCQLLFLFISLLVYMIPYFADSFWFLTSSCCSPF